VLWGALLSCCKSDDVCENWTWSDHLNTSWSLSWWSSGGRVIIWESGWNLQRNGSKMRKNCLPVKETRNNLRLDPYMGWTASTPVWPNSFGPCAGQTADVFAIYLFKFYFSNCTCSFVGNLMKFKLNTKQCDELTLGDDDMITVVRKWGICSREIFVHNQLHKVFIRHQQVCELELCIMYAYQNELCECEW